MRESSVRRWAALVAVLLLPRGLGGWWASGHGIINRAAVRMLPADMPAFFTSGGDALVFYSADPDAHRDRSLPGLRSAEGPEHYLDLELLQGRDLPPTRAEYLSLCGELRVEPGKAGTLPYAILEWHDRLVLAFAEHRRWPDDERVRWKALYIAGILSHYAGDASQPLHCTVHFDGKAKPDGTSPYTGIHARVDALPEKAGIRPEEIAGGFPSAESDILALAVRTIRASHYLVSRVYRMEDLLPPAEGEVRADPKARALALDCCTRGAALVATLWYSAWRRSEGIQLPSWKKQ